MATAITEILPVCSRTLPLYPSLNYNFIRERGKP